MAIKCANCEKDADYTTADPGVNPVDYCATCLPTWLRDRASAGHFPLVEPTPKTKEKTAKSPE